jgi:hypothetical protein
LLFCAFFINKLVFLHKKEVLEKLQYRKTVVDCFNTWRSAYIGTIVVGLSFFVYLIFLISTFSLILAFVWTCLLQIYCLLSVYSYDMIVHSIQIYRTFRLKDTENFEKLCSLKRTFIQELKKLNLE